MSIDVDPITEILIAAYKAGIDQCIEYLKKGFVWQAHDIKKWSSQCFIDFDFKAKLDNEKKILAACKTDIMNAFGDGALEALEFYEDGHVLRSSISRKDYRDSKRLSKRA